MMEITCALTLTLVSLVAATPHGYGFEGGASATAEASAVAGGLGGLPISIPSGAGFTGSFSKTAFSNFASSSASSSSSYFSYSGSGSSELTESKSFGGCSTGGCQNGEAGTAGPQELNSFGVNGYQAFSGHNVAVATEQGAAINNYRPSANCVSGNCDIEIVSDTQPQPSYYDSFLTTNQKPYLTNQNPTAYSSGLTSGYDKLVSHLTAPELKLPTSSYYPTRTLETVHTQGTTEHTDEKMWSGANCDYNPSKGPATTVDSANASSNDCGNSKSTANTVKQSPTASSSEVAQGDNELAINTTTPKPRLLTTSSYPRRTVNNGQIQATYSPNYGKACSGGNCDNNPTKSPVTSVISYITPSEDYGHLKPNADTTYQNPNPFTRELASGDNKPTSDITTPKPKLLTSSYYPRKTVNTGYTQGTPNDGNACSGGNCDNNPTNSHTPSEDYGHLKPNADTTYQNPNPFTSELASGDNKPATDITTTKPKLLTSSYYPRRTVNIGHTQGTPNDRKACNGGNCDDNTSKSPVTSVISDNTPSEDYGHLEPNTGKANQNPNTFTSELASGDNKPATDITTPKPKLLTSSYYPRRTVNTGHTQGTPNDGKACSGGYCDYNPSKSPVTSVISDNTPSEDYGYLKPNADTTNQNPNPLTSELASGGNKPATDITTPKPKLLTSSYYPRRTVNTGHTQGTPNDRIACSGGNCDYNPSKSPVTSVISDNTPSEDYGHLEPNTGTANQNPNTFTSELASGDNKPATDITTPKPKLLTSSYYPRRTVNTGHTQGTPNDRKACTGGYCDYNPTKGPITSVDSANTPSEDYGYLKPNAGAANENPTVFSSEVAPGEIKPATDITTPKPKLLTSSYYPRKTVNTGHTQGTPNDGNACSGGNCDNNPTNSHTPSEDYGHLKPNADTTYQNPNPFTSELASGDNKPATDITTTKPKLLTSSYYPRRTVNIGHTQGTPNDRKACNGGNCDDNTSKSPVTSVISDNTPSEDYGHLEPNTGKANQNPNTFTSELASGDNKPATDITTPKPKLLTSSYYPRRTVNTGHTQGTPNDGKACSGGYCDYNPSKSPVTSVISDNTPSEDYGYLKPNADTTNQNPNPLTSELASGGNKPATDITTPKPKLLTSSYYPRRTVNTGHTQGTPNDRIACSGGNCDYNPSKSPVTSVISDNTPSEDYGHLKPNAYTTNQNPNPFTSELASGDNKPATDITTPKPKLLTSSYYPRRTVNTGHTQGTPNDGKACSGGNCDYNPSKSPVTSVISDNTPSEDYGHLKPNADTTNQNPNPFTSELASGDNKPATDITTPKPKLLTSSYYPRRTVNTGHTQGTPNDRIACSGGNCDNNPSKSPVTSVISDNTPSEDYGYLKPNTGTANQNPNPFTSELASGDNKPTSDITTPKPKLLTSSYYPRKTVNTGHTQGTPNDGKACSGGNCDNNPTNSHTPSEDYGHLKPNADTTNQNPNPFTSELASGDNKPATDITTPKPKLLTSSYYPRRTVNTGHTQGTPNDRIACSGGYCDYNPSKSPVTSVISDNTPFEDYGHLKPNADKTNQIPNPFTSELASGDNKPATDITTPKPKLLTSSYYPRRTVNTGHTQGTPNDQKACSGGNCDNNPAKSPVTSVISDNTPSEDYGHQKPNADTTNQNPNPFTSELASGDNKPATDITTPKPKLLTSSYYPRRTVNTGHTQGTPNDQKACSGGNCDNNPAKSPVTSVISDYTPSEDYGHPKPNADTTNQNPNPFTSELASGDNKPATDITTPKPKLLTSSYYPRRTVNTGHTQGTPNDRKACTGGYCDYNPTKGPITSVDSANTPSEDYGYLKPNAGAANQNPTVFSSEVASDEIKPATDITTPKPKLLTSSHYPTRTVNTGHSTGTHTDGNICSGGNCDYNPLKVRVMSTQSGTKCMSSNCLPNAYNNENSKIPSYLAASGYQVPTGPGFFNVPPNCATGNCATYTSAQLTNGFSSVFADQKQSVYTGGFGGAAGILKPNDFSFSPQVPASHIYSKSTVPLAAHSLVTCASGNCESPHLHGSYSNGRKDTANAAASTNVYANAVAYSGGFGGPPGLLKPYDDGTLTTGYIGR